MEKNDGTQEREQEGQPQGEGNHGAEAEEARAEEVAGATHGTAGTGTFATQRACALESQSPSSLTGAGASVPDEWQAKLDAKDAEMADMKVGYELQLAGAKNVKAAKALLGDHKGDIAALEEAEPWLFEAAAAPKDETPPGKTGLSNAEAATDEGAQLKRWRKIAGLEEE